MIVIHLYHFDMSTEPANMTKTPAEIYQLADRSAQVHESARLLEFALREYSGNYRLGFTSLYNENRKLFDKELRDRIRPAFEVRGKIRNVEKYGDVDFESKTSAAETFIEAAEILFKRYQKIYPEKFWPTEVSPNQNDGFFDQGFEPVNDTGLPAGAYTEVRQVAAEKERAEIQPALQSPSAFADQKTESVHSEKDGNFEVPTYDLVGPGGLFPPKFKFIQLERTCNQLGRSLRAGIPITTAWETEAKGFSGRIGESFQAVLQDIAGGETLHSAITRHDCFPPMFCEMVRVGEETGRLDQTFLRLSDHYRSLVQMRRTFISGITWPIFQFCAAIGVISLFFIALSILEAALPTFVAPDIFLLGLGPIGNLVLFWVLLTMGASFVFGMIKGISNGWFGQLPMSLALQIPLIGKTIRILCLSRFSWSFGMAIEAGMDAQRAIQLGVRATNNHFYMVHEPQILESVEQGSDFYSALRQTEAFPDDFLQALEVGEITGEITESLGRLSDDYREQAEMLLRRISQICGFLVSIFVMGIIILLIVLAYMNYLGTINEALSNPMGSLQQYQSGQTAGKSSNPITAAKNQMVNQIMQSEDMQNITKMYEAMGRADELHGDKLLDAILAPFEEKK